ncbi:MAG TPA: hypothetical protein VEF53_18880 [Patescibacteria group bacterium]|nr:hypothetical protein [Patescibacteria group bacterium]
MIKFIINLAEMYLFAIVIYKAIRFFMPHRGKHGRKSITGKVTWIVSNKIHRRLDRIIKAQKAANPTTPSQHNVVEFKSRKAK